MKFILVQDLLKIFLFNHQLANIALYLSREEVTAVLDERIKMSVELLGKLAQFSLDGKPPTKKTWKEQWEKEIKILSQNEQGTGKKWYQFWK